MTEFGSRGNDIPATGETTNNPFHGLFHRVGHAAHTAYTAVSEKAHVVASDPHVQKGTHIVGNIGVGVVEGVKRDGQGMAHDVQTGNYAGAALRAAPLLAGGPAGLIAREVAPKVISEGVKQLPPGARYQVENSGVGRIAMRGAENGHIPTSPLDFARIAAASAKQSAVDVTIRTAVNGNGPAGGRQPIQVEVGATTQRGILPKRPYQGQIMTAATLQHALPTVARLQNALPAPTSWQRESQAASAPPRELPSTAMPQRDIRVPAVASRINLPAPQAAHDAGAAPSNVVNKGNQVFPSWMTPAANTQAKR